MQFIFELGEPVFDLDQGKLYIGDGFTYGGIIATGEVADLAPIYNAINDLTINKADKSEITDFLTALDIAPIYVEDRKSVV